MDGEITKSRSVTAHEKNPFAQLTFSLPPRRDRALMAFEDADGLAALQVPEPQRVVFRAREGTAAVGRYRHGRDPSPYGRRGCGLEGLRAQCE
jgi:hypothetical protein